jgi:hypothetical protein
MHSDERKARNQSKSRKPLGFLPGLLVVFAIVVCLYSIMTGIKEGWDLLEAPWAHSFSGQPTLTGTWTGEFTSKSGTQFALYLALGRARRPDGRYNTQRSIGAIIDGYAQWCDSSGRHVAQVPISGSVPTFTGFNATADKVHIALLLAGQTVAGLWPDELDGTWKGDSLMLHPSLSNWDGVNTVSTTDEASKSLTFTMKKDGHNTYRALCKRLGVPNPQNDRRDL